jgi:phosphate transport system substrate-binding protein
MKPSLFRRARFALSALLVGCLLSLPIAGKAETVRIGGTGAALGTMERMALEFRKRQPDFSYEVIPNLGSGGGLKALAKGAIQIAVMSRPMSPEERSADFVVVEYGRTPFVVVTAKSGIKSISRAQLVDLYGVVQARWPDGSPVRPVLRPATDIDSELLAQLSPEMKPALASAMAREGMVVAATDRESADAIEKLPGAVGTSSLALLLSEGRRLTPLAIDGVQPSVRTLADGSYPYAKTMSMVVHRNPPAATGKFLAFVASDEGRRVLVETGHVPPAKIR